MDNQVGRANPQLQQARQLFDNLSLGRKTVLIASVAGFIFSFFPWYSVSGGVGPYSFSASESGWHGWGLLASLLFIVAGVWVVLPLAGVSWRGLLAALPHTVNEARLVMALGGVAALATLLFILTEGHDASGLGFSAGPSFGAYVGLIAAVAIAAGGFLLQNEPATV